MTHYADSSFLVSCYVLDAHTADILHVAAARSLRARHFLTFDARQAALAGRSGLTVLP